LRSVERARRTFADLRRWKRDIIIVTKTNPWMIESKETMQETKLTKP
jgi:hypothetical protein